MTAPSTKTLEDLLSRKSLWSIALQAAPKVHNYLQEEVALMSNGGGRSAGIGVWGFGSMVAITLSWSVNHSILWMIVHGIFSWFYVIYYAVEK